MTRNWPKGFTQVLITASLRTNNEIILQTHLKALRNLSINEEISIIVSDKDGAIVILNRNTVNEKLRLLFNGTNAYEKIDEK